MPIGLVMMSLWFIMRLYIYIFNLLSIRTVFDIYFLYLNSCYLCCSPSCYITDDLCLFKGVQASHTKTALSVIVMYL